MTATLLIVMTSSLLTVAVLLLYFFLRHNKKPQENLILLMQQQLEGMRQELRGSLEGVTMQVNDRLKEQSQVLTNSGKNMNDRLDNASKAFASLNNELGQLKEGSKRILKVGEDISLLQESMRSPKFRGGFGEFLLGDLLGQILPTEHYQLQYGFKNGERVDAVVFTQEGTISIDSKFPLENFRRLIESPTEEAKKVARKDFISDVKKHINAIAEKYICPDEGTMNFALMYIPAENIFYETILKDETSGLLEHSQSKRVFPVSPNSFFAYLQTIAIGLRGMKIATWAKELDASLERLKVDLSRFSSEFGQIGTHIKNARGKFDTAEKRLGQFGDRLDQLVVPSGDSPAIDAEPVKLKSVESK